MAKFEDYLPGGESDPTALEGGIDDEIKSADDDQLKRDENATSVDWEERYKNLEKLNSQQAQTVGEYRRVIDDYIINPTPASEAAQEDSGPITSEDLYENPDEAISKAIASHPAIKRAEQIEAQFEAQEKGRALDTFKESHPDYLEIKDTPEFASWVRDNSTRRALASSADQWDMNSADALFSLYKAEQGLSKATAEKQEADAIQAATLEDSSNVLITTEAKYSRGEFIDMKMKANQGDQEAERWINRNIAAYRVALQGGSVRD